MRRPLLSASRGLMMHTTTAQLNKEQPIRKLGLKLKPSQCLVRGLATILKKKKSKTLEGNKKKLTTGSAP